MNRRTLPSAIAVVVAAILLASCASQPSTIPGVKIEQLSRSTEMRMETASGVPVDFRVTIDNPSPEAVTLLSIEVESVGSSGGYTMNRFKQVFERVIAANSSDQVDFRAWVQPLSRDQKGEMSSPVMLRGAARFQTSAGVVRRNFTGN